MKAYLDEFVNDLDKRRRTRLEHLKELRAQHANILKAKQKILEQFAPKLGAGDPKNVQVWYQMRVKHLGLAKDQLFAGQTKIRKLEIDLAAQEKARERARSGAGITDAMVEKHLETDPLILRYQDKVAGLEQYVASVRESASAEFANKVLRTKRQVGRARQRPGKVLEARRKDLLPRKRKELQDKALNRTGCQHRPDAVSDNPPEGGGEDAE